MIKMSSPDWLTSENAQRRLGVRPQTLYAYVSRGRVQVKPDPADPRRSLYRTADIEALVARKRRSRRVADVAAATIAWGEPILESGISCVLGGRLYYRGEDAVRLAETESLESIARLLRQGRSDHVAGAERAPLATASDWRGRAYTALAVRAAGAPPLLGGSARHAEIEAETILGLVADAITGSLTADPIHERLSRGWRAGPDGADLIRRMLVLVADHELNASTFAARVAASTGASLAAAVLAGMAALSGPRHGAASVAVQRFAAEALAASPATAVRERVAEGRHIPGFGHPLYATGDVRAKALTTLFKASPLYAELEEVVRDVTGLEPNIDFAMVTAADALRLPMDAPAALFATARTAGWVAHALEQSQAGLIRPRARYVGRLPDEGARKRHDA